MLKLEILKWPKWWTMLTWPENRIILCWYKPKLLGRPQLTSLLVLTFFFFLIYELLDWRLNPPRLTWRRLGFDPRSSSTTLFYFSLFSYPGEIRSMHTNKIRIEMIIPSSISFITFRCIKMNRNGYSDSLPLLPFHSTNLIIHFPLLPILHLYLFLKIT